MREELLYCPIEAYKARYTELLPAWERRAFGQKFSITEIVPKAKDSFVVLDILQGEVLDAVARPAWCMQQTLELLKKAPNIGKIWFSDFYHTGLDALYYSRSNFKACSFLWAQSFDKYDFTRKMINWMRPWEVMAFEIYEKVFVAYDLLKDLIV